MQTPKPVDEERRYDEAIDIANIPTLLMVLVHLTGDVSWLEEPYRPHRSGGLSDNDTGGLPEDVQQEIREAAKSAIRAWVQGSSPVLGTPSNDLFVEMLSVAMDEPIPPEYGPLLTEDFANAGLGPGEPSSTEPLEGARHVSALIVGAGISGLCAALHLQRLGIPYTILERNHTVGGVWFENSYPGAGVDTPNHLYSFAEIPHDWEHYFALQPEIRDYLERVANEIGAYQNTKFGVSVTSAVYSPETQGWDVTAQDESGEEFELHCDILISAVGAFNEPKSPDIEGLERFEKPSFHTARWRHDVDLAGKHVAVIGNGASAMQVVPAIAPEVRQLTIFQRSPQWAAPFEKLHKEVPDPIRFLLRNVPLYRWWYRQRLNWVFNDRLHASLKKDPEWSDPRSLNATNEGFRRFFTRYIEAELGKRRDLLPAVVPDYPPYGKRILLDNGWYATLTRENVELINEGVCELVHDRVVTESGRKVEPDVLIFATGFDVARFVSTYEVFGVDGQTLRDEWDDDNAMAYLGASVPGFPNFFMLYGPNTQAGHGGSVIWNLETQMGYIARLIADMIRRGVGAIEPRRDVYERYNSKIDELHAEMIWTHTSASTYYRNSLGRVVVPLPFRNVDFWHLARKGTLKDYVLHPSVRVSMSGSCGP